MARIRLYAIDNDRQTLVDAAQNKMDLVYLRLTAMFRIASERRTRDGLFDSGTAFTVFPESIWRRFENEIQWLSFATQPPIPPWWTSVSGLTGGSFPCRLGRVHFTLVDLEGNRVDDVPIIGKFVADDGKLAQRILLGLAHGILQGRRLSLDAERGEAWLEDRA